MSQCEQKDMSIICKQQFLKVSKTWPPALNGRFAKRGTTTIGR